MDEKIKNELDEAVLDTFETVNDEDTSPEQAGIAIQAGEILSRTRNELRKTDAEIEKLQAEAERIRCDTELAKSQVSIDKRRYIADHIISGVGLASVLYYERANIIGTKTFQSVYGSFLKSCSNVGKLFKK